MQNRTAGWSGWVGAVFGSLPPGRHSRTCTPTLPLMRPAVGVAQ
jgi:hypothetical protein